MSLKRRDFLKLGGTFAAAYAFQSTACKVGAMTGNTKIADDFGLQLYSLRDVLPADPKGVLEKVASYGYKQIESYEGKDGMFWGMSNTEFKSYMDQLGMRIIASHTDINKDFEKKVDDAAAIGMKYLICPYKGPQKSIDDFKKIAEDFNKKGEICKKGGIRFGYHNHDYSFKPVDGQLPQNVMMDNTDPALVDFEMDIFWVVAGGADPVEWMKKYKNRFRLCHVKDRSKTPGPNEGKNSCDLGKGSIDYDTVLKTALKNGIQYYIVEQEFYPDSTSLESAKADAAYMKSLKI
jgi:sugar phosphate isomerase/epimerase